ncbi:hypothetical protein RUR49_04325 [Pseudoxanthobacter sp. M-2]|uniref:hypothetical protein n=1 Tax=Pseudoxanthobacter sp. M-2 TaxID=3078754 RepID=UPI0038FC9237
MSRMEGARESRAHAATFFTLAPADLVARLEAIVEAGIELLDWIEGDSDYEPSLDSPCPHYFAIDAEADDADDEDDGCSEPSLAAPETELRGADYLFPDGATFAHAEPLGSQVGWSRGGDDDREDEDEHGGDIQEEPHDDGLHCGADSEPSLGWTIDGQVGCNSDREKDPSGGPYRRRRLTATRPSEPPPLVEIDPEHEAGLCSAKGRIFTDSRGRRFPIPPAHRLPPLAPGERLFIDIHGASYRFAPRSPAPAVEVVR